MQVELFIIDINIVVIVMSVTSSTSIMRVKIIMDVSGGNDYGTLSNRNVCYDCDGLRTINRRNHWYGSHRC